jgi:S-adenosylmethionine decarboxylase proenzyme
MRLGDEAPAVKTGTETKSGGPGNWAARCGALRGLHLTADLRGCAAAAPLTDAAALAAACRAAVQAAGLQAVGELFHAFPPPGGVTGVVLLAESHLALHTWPEAQAVTLDVFVCNLSADNRDRARALMASMEALFGAAEVRYHRIERGVA